DAVDHPRYSTERRAAANATGFSLARPPPPPSDAVDHTRYSTERRAAANATGFSLARPPSS
ncbi:MAG TPA: hypothetical protein VNN80_35210, partial [Polyangiaceae bacterium]|nr:hypothetical protein [Polyangiaceae bacterium]